MLEAIRALYAYSAWANTRILDTAERLSLQQFITPHERAPAIRDLLVHTADTQWTWLERWQGRSPGATWDPADFPYVATLRARWTVVEAETQAYIEALSEPELQRVLSYVNFRGETWSYPLWQQILHQANHATQHRGEVALLLTQSGHSPGDLDLLVRYDLMSEG
jgi:uncharacterized damage-inducible protein DinB